MSIEHIIYKREPLTEHINQVYQKLNDLSSTLNSLEQFYLELKNAPNSPISSDTTFTVVPLLEQISTLARDWAQSKGRFTRKTLNIGIVGRARQGKSRLLQSLTGLSSQAIPDSDRQHCTGVRSTIYHSDFDNAGAEITFHTEESLIKEVIAPYYEVLPLGTVPANFQQFLHTPLPHPSGMSAEAGAKLEHLKKYQQYADKYRHHLLHNGMLKITHEQILEYVAQHHPDNPEETYYNYLAVQNVNIYCNYPNDRVKQIAFIDMPGLGDTGVGDAPRLIHALGKEVDLVLFVKMPKAMGDHWSDVDVALYDTAHQALQEIAMEKWSFLILNSLADGSNAKNCFDLASTYQTHHINVVQALIANCSDTEDSVNKVLLPVLDYMGQHIADLDQDYMQSRCHTLQQFCQTDVDTFLTHAQSLFKEHTGKVDEERVFTALFNSFWRALTNELSIMLKELHEKRKKEDIFLQESLDQIMQKAKQGDCIPSLETAKEYVNLYGGVPNAYYELLHELRNKIIFYLQDLDKGLEQSIEHFKQLVVDRLKKLGLQIDASTGSIYLDKLCEMIKEDASLFALYEGFFALNSFHLSYRGLIQHRIREHLDDMVPNTTQIRLPASPSEQHMLAALDVAYKEALFKIDKEIKALLWEPSMAGFVVIEEFVDRVLRSEDIRTQWRFFIWEQRKTIWPVDFQWYTLIQTADNINQSLQQNISH